MFSSEVRNDPALRNDHAMAMQQNSGWRVHMKSPATNAPKSRT